MARSENRSGREQQQNRRATKTDTAESAPLVSAKRGKFETLKDAKVEALIFARLMDYKSFVKEVEGEEPEDGAIISASLEMLLDADLGFERWAVEQRRKERQPEDKNTAHAHPRRATMNEAAGDSA